MLAQICHVALKERRAHFPHTIGVSCAILKMEERKFKDAENLIDLADWAAENGAELPGNIMLWDGPECLGKHQKGKRKNYILKAILYTAIVVFIASCLVIFFLPWVGFIGGVSSMTWIGLFGLANGWFV